MAKIAFKPRTFKPDQMVLIAKINQIFTEYQVKITLRQLFYRLVVANAIPNKDTVYDSLGNLVGEARMAGMIDWDAIEDRIRFLKGKPFVESPAEAVNEVLDKYALDLWWNQDFRPEVWVEKDAQSSIVGAACLEERVNFFVARGYASLSSYYEAGNRLRCYVEKGQTPVILYLGDHDPSGIHMAEDVRSKLATFTGVNVIVDRIALNIDQVYKYEMPPNPAKMSDSRAAAYVERHGDSSWELDAFPPDELQKLISAKIAVLRDEKKWSEALVEEVEDKEALKQIAQDTFGEDNNG
jgi:hypothetical protein